MFIYLEVFNLILVLLKNSQIIKLFILLERLISPLVYSSDLGLSEMACLLGDLNHGKSESDFLLRACATVIHFPTLITSMYRIIHNNQVLGNDITNATSTLYTFFRAYIPPLCSDNKVFEYALRMCN